MLTQCEEFATPEAVLVLDKEQLRGVGLSYAKVCAKAELLAMHGSVSGNWSTMCGLGAHVVTDISHITQMMQVMLASVACACFHYNQGHCYYVAHVHSMSSC